ncbi:Component of the spindle pole body outer plaque, putative, partial [Candida maltosa Xu316]
MTSRIESSTHPLAMETQITNETGYSEDHDEQSSGSTTKNSGPDTTKLSDENNKQTKGPEEQQQFSILEQSSPQVKPRSYASKLSYIPNEDFPANQTSMFESSPGASIPNTFKYKSHPNAKAKALGTTTRITEEGSTELHEDVQNHEPTNGAAHTTTNDNTKEWMPKELATKELGSNWILQNSDELKLPVNDFPSVRIKNGSDNNSPFQDFDLNTANTMIHNSNVQSETPAFKKANKEYEEQRGKDLFPNIFVQQNPEEVNAKDHSASSTFSTPFNSINKLPPQALETVRESKDTNNNPSSPLKLYGSKYDTFTKSKLNNILDNMAKSTKNTPIQSQSQQKQKPKAQEQNSKEHNEKENVPPAIKFNPSITNTPPVKNIKDFTKTGAYSETTFIKHADNVFTNIKKRGFKGNTDGVRVVSQATATSTPKKSINIEDPIDFGPDNDYASYTSGYSSDDTNDIEHNPSQHSYHNFEVSSDDPQNYTSYTRDSNSQMRPESQEHEIIQHHSSSSGTYTFDEMSDKSDEPGTTEINPINSNYMSQDTKAHLYQAKIVQNRIPLFEQENSQLMENVKKPVDTTNISYKSSVPDSSYRPNSFKWKTRSQLELNNRPEIGRFGPDVTLPSRYESVGMVFDQENQRWLSSNEKSVQDAFRSIDDLSIGPAEQSTMNGTSQQEPQQQQHQSILKKASTKRNGGTLEVSFHEPDISVESTNHNPMLGDVTRLSQIPELSFSESKKKLVPVITEVLELGNSLEPVSWKEIREIKLNNNDLNNVKDLNALLPSLISADLSHNDIKYLTGIPKQILSLNLSDNRIENITPFSDYRDLRDLNLENNQLTTVSNLDKNVHLTRLSLKNNQILNIKGISNLMNLTYLNVSRNELQGKLNFNMYDFQNLAVLDLSENNIQEILGLQNLPKLKVLDLDNNGLIKFEGRSKSLVKLSIRFNNVRKLNVSKVPQLRALKFDGNQIEKIEGLEVLGKLEEISCKSQFRSSIVDQILQTTKDVRKLDLSGNRHFTNTTSIFPFVNSLTLSATNLSEIPTNFAVQFPNVQSLNLSFNKLKDINGLKELKNLRKVYMVDNKLQSFKQLTKGLTGSKSTLRVLDVRLNPCTENIYPYLFSPEELETSALNIENGDDIQSFLIRYEELDKSELWTTRDEIFLEHLKSRKDVELLGSRDIFECAMVTYFFNLSRLDGNWIDDDRRQYFDTLSKHS